MRKDNHLDPKDLPQGIISETYMKLPLEEKHPLNRLKLSDLGIDIIVIGEI